MALPVITCMNSAELTYYMKYFLDEITFLEIRINELKETVNNIEQIVNITPTFTISNVSQKLQV